MTLSQNVKLLWRVRIELNTPLICTNYLDNIDLSIQTNSENFSPIIGLVHVKAEPDSQITGLYLCFELVTG